MPLIFHVVTTGNKFRFFCRTVCLFVLFFRPARKIFLYSCRSFTTLIFFPLTIFSFFFFFSSQNLSLLPDRFLYAPWNILCYTFLLEEITIPASKFLSYVLYWNISCRLCMCFGRSLPTLKETLLLITFISQWTILLHLLTYILLCFFSSIRRYVYRLSWGQTESDTLTY